MSEMKCQTCGKAIRTGSWFCVRCGVMVANAPAARPAGGGKYTVAVVAAVAVGVAVTAIYFLQQSRPEQPKVTLASVPSYIPPSQDIPSRPLISLPSPPTAIKRKQLALLDEPGSPPSLMVQEGKLANGHPAKELS